MEYWLKFISVILSVALADICWTYYMIKVGELKAIASGLWSTAIIALGSFTVSEYVQDKSLVIAACIGSFIGTTGSVMWKKYKNSKDAKINKV
jgi:hypothetical protein